MTLRVFCLLTAFVCSHGTHKTCSGDKLEAAGCGREGSVGCSKGWRVLQPPPAHEPNEHALPSASGSERGGKEIL